MAKSATAISYFIGPSRQVALPNASDETLNRLTVAFPIYARPSLYLPGSDCDFALNLLRGRRRFRLVPLRRSNSNVPRLCIYGGLSNDGGAPTIDYRVRFPFSILLWVSAAIAVAIAAGSTFTIVGAASSPVHVGAIALGISLTAFFLLVFIGVGHAVANEARIDGPALEQAMLKSLGLD